MWPTLLARMCASRVYAPTIPFSAPAKDTPTFIRTLTSWCKIPVTGDMVNTVNIFLRQKAEKYVIALQSPHRYAPAPMNTARAVPSSSHQL